MHQYTINVLLKVPSVYPFMIVTDFAIRLRSMGELGLAGVELQRDTPVSDFLLYLLRTGLTGVCGSYFAKSEGYRPSSDFPNIKGTDRGTSGPWTTGHPPSPLAVSIFAALIRRVLTWRAQPVCQAAHDACVNLGIPELGCVDRCLGQPRLSSSTKRRKHAPRHLRRC